MTICSLDVETSTYSSGNCYDSRNTMCLAGLGFEGDKYSILNIEYDDSPYREELQTLRTAIEKAEPVVYFNAKFDLNWCRSYGLPYPERIWDCQLVHFILTNQTNPYPSLNGVAEYYGLGTKIDKIAEYWDQGIQTNDIDYHELSDYLKQDLNLTLQIYHKQKEELESKPHLKKLVNVSMMDTLVLADMEYSGLLFDFEKSKKNAEELQEKLSSLNAKLACIYDIDGINWNSNDHLSAILYGGILKVSYRESYERVLKDGTIRVRERDAIKEVEMPRLVEPLKGSECAKEGYWKTAEDVLKSLKAKGKAKEIITIVLERSLIDKELNTYALGLPKLYEEMHWQNSKIYGNLNQCVARTGRLSSSRPNRQNLSEGAKRCIISRFK